MGIYVFIQKILELRRISEPFNAAGYFQPHLTSIRSTCCWGFEEATVLIVQYGDWHKNQCQRYRTDAKEEQPKSKHLPSH